MGWSKEVKQSENKLGAGYYKNVKENSICPEIVILNLGWGSEGVHSDVLQRS